MRLLLSPTKKQIINSEINGISTPEFLDKSTELINKMLDLGRDGIKELLSISDKLTDENWLRLNQWKDDITPTSPAIFTFVGEVFSSLDPFSFKKRDIEYANSVLRIFSGLYGILKPMDSIKPYRLDIKDSLHLKEYPSLYSYWREDLTEYIKNDIYNDDELIIDLCSKEYSQSVDFNKIPGVLITPNFKTEINGKLKTVAMWSKRMRGLLAREIILNRVENISRLKDIKLPGYKLEDCSNGNYLYIKNKEN